jgi:hypothetical protein
VFPDDVAPVSLRGKKVAWLENYQCKSPLEKRQLLIAKLTKPARSSNCRLAKRDLLLRRCSYLAPQIHHLDAANEAPSRSALDFGGIRQQKADHRPEAKAASSFAPLQSAKQKQARNLRLLLTRSVLYLIVFSLMLFQSFLIIVPAALDES